MTGTAGLSQGHIRADGVVSLHRAKAEVYQGASLGKVTRELVEKKCAVCGELFKVEAFRVDHVTKCFMCREVKRECIHCGKVFRVTTREFRTKDFIYCRVCGCENPGCKRGKVTRFSFDSKHRLMLILNQVKRSVANVSFLTLTYPDEFYGNHDNPERCKDDLRLFEWRFRREFPKGSFVWRLEYEDRKSGDHIGAIFPHFHLLVFNVHIGRLRSFVFKSWHEIAGCGSPDHLKVLKHEKSCTPVLSRRGVMAYAAKAVGSVMSSELAKDLQAKGLNVGRWWGIIARDVFDDFLAKAKELLLSDPESAALIRLFRKYVQRQVSLKWVNAGAGKRWKKPKHRAFCWRSAVVFLDGRWLLKTVKQIISPSQVLCYSTGRRYGPDCPETFLDFALRNGLVT